MTLDADTSLGPYRVLDKLGEGGMGVVYLAEDPRLNRQVAIKVLPPDMTRDTTAKQRFLQEAKAASALDHPNICNIHEINETADGRLYLVMAHYEGETLKERIARGALALEDTIDIASQVGQGLAEAHRAGIVHRDVKPANLLVTKSGVVKILDFGLAKLVGEDSVTQAGTVGTVAYMSPEQARGAAFDHRTDIWSLGVVLYEMLTGELPFQGDNLLSLADAIRSDEPRPVRGEAASLNPALGRALSKTPALRYGAVTDLLDDLRSGRRTGAAVPPADNAVIPSIAVLPFADMSPQKDQDYFCEGLAEELIDMLARLDTLRVVARTSAFQFKGQARDLRDVGEKLNVGHVLEGSVRKAGDRLRVNVQLINTDDGYHIWSERFDRDLDDVFAVQDEIGRAVVQKLKPRLLGTVAETPGTTTAVQEPALGRHVHPVGPAAHEAYLKGRYHAGKRSAASLRQAVEHFQDALRQEPAYAAAHAGLAECLTMQATGYEGDSKLVAERARAAAVAAVELDADLAEAQARPWIRLLPARLGVGGGGGGSPEGDRRLSISRTR